MEKPVRPLVLGGITVKVVTGCGNMYVQLNWYHGRLFEVFATLGKSGGCAICQSEGLTRSVTLGLKYGVPVAEFVRQLRGTRCPNPVLFPQEQAVLSCPDALSKALASYGTLTVDKVMELLRDANGQASRQVEQVDPVGDDLAATELSAADVAARVQDLAREREAQGLYL